MEHLPGHLVTPFFFISFVPHLFIPMGILDNSWDRSLAPLYSHFLVTKAACSLVDRCARSNSIRAFNMNNSPTQVLLLVIG